MTYRRHSAHSTAHPAAALLLPIVLLRLAVDLVLLACRLAVWLLLRLCWLLEAGLDHLGAPRPKTAIVEIRPKRVRAQSRSRPENASISPYRSIEHHDVDPTDVVKLMKILGRRDAGTRALAERMLRDGTRVPITEAQPCAPS